MKRFNIRQFFDHSLYYAPERALAFPMDDPHLEDSALSALREIVRYEVFHLMRSEGVQIKRSVYGELNGVVIVHLSVEVVLSLGDTPLL
jgi:hypothetical protein